jgi:NAD(P)-dependent dehydrogenase (short-subunit alcohol dehydrogenase family)
MVPARRSNASGETAIVTGGTRRLGRHFSDALAGMGYDLVVTCSAAQPLDERTAFVAHMQQRHGVAAAVVEADFSRPDEAQMGAILSACPGPPTCLVNNAGIFEWDDLATLEHEAVSRTLNVNLVAPMLLTSHFARVDVAPRLRRSVVSILDQKLFNPYPDHFTYTVSKAGLAMFVEMSARSAGALYHYGIALGLTLPAPGQSHEDFLSAQRTVPLCVGPGPAEVTGWLAFLLSGAARNGTVVTIDGGASLAGRKRDFQFHCEGDT